MNEINVYTVKHICDSEMLSITEKYEENGPPDRSSSPGFGANCCSSIVTESCPTL